MMILNETMAFVRVFYLAISVITFVIYFVDKVAAKQGAWRVAENTLHGLSLFGGWPGAIVAQKLLRHKSRKQPFRFVFWITVLLNVCLLVGYLILTQEPTVYLIYKRLGFVLS